MARFHRFLMVGCVLACRAGISGPVYFDVYVPGDTDRLYVDDVALGGVGTYRALQTQIDKPGDYKYRIRVEHDGASVERVVTFTGTESRIPVRFTSDDFGGAKIVALVKSSRESYRSQDSGRLTRAKSALTAAMGVLDPMIDRSESKEVWRERLHWAALSTAIQADSPDATQLEGIYRKLFVKKPGMELDEVQRFRDAVRELRDAAYFASLKDGETVFKKTLDEISDLLPRFEKEQRSEDRIELGKRISWLERGGLAPQLTQAVQARYSRMNAVNQFHIDVIRKYATKEVNKAKSGDYRILGNPTHTSSVVNGTTYLRFIPSAETAEVEVGMTGTMHSHSSSVGGERGVTVRVQGETFNDVMVSKRISVLGMSQDKIVSHEPTACVVPRGEGPTPLINVYAKPIMPRLPPRLQFIRRAKERIGYETALERIPLGQAEGRSIASSELVTEAKAPIDVPSDVKNVAQQYEALIKEFFVLEQKRSGVEPRKQWLSTDENWLYMKHIRRNEDELAAFTPAPEFRGKDPLGVRVHESEVTNTANRQFSGQDLTDADVEGFARSVLNYVPPQLRLGTHAARWKTKFIDDHPFVVDFGDDRIEMVARFQKLEISAHGDKPARVFLTPFAVRTVYRIQKKDSPMLSRLEEAKLERLDDPKKALDPELVKFFNPKAQALFKEELYFDGFTPVRGGIFEPLTKIIVKEIRTENNWLLVAGELDGDLLEIIKKTPSGLGGDSRVIPEKK